MALRMCLSLSALAIVLGVIRLFLPNPYAPGLSIAASFLSLGVAAWLLWSRRDHRRYLAELDRHGE